MRYLVCYIDPKTGRERLGTGAHAQSFGYYVSIGNVIRFQLAHENYPAGQYHIYPWPEGTPPPTCKPHVAYKRV